MYRRDLCERVVKNLNCQFEIASQASGVDVGRTDTRVVVINDNWLGMNKRRELKRNTNSPLQEFQEQLAR